MNSMITAHSSNVVYTHRLEITPGLVDTVNNYTHTGKTFEVSRVSLRWEKDDLPNEVRVYGKVYRKNGTLSGFSGESSYYLRHRDYMAQAPAPDWLIEIIREASIEFEEKSA